MTARKPRNTARADAPPLRPHLDARDKRPAKSKPSPAKPRTGATVASDRQAPPVEQDLVGLWRLTLMSLWNRACMDVESPAFIEFAVSGRGAFHFGFVDSGIDWQPEQGPSRPGAAFTFDGHDEMHPTRGRGRAAVRTDGKLNGRLHFHRGDGSTLIAVRLA